MPCFGLLSKQQKTKQGQRPALKFFQFMPVSSKLFFLWSGLRLIAPPVLPPSDLDHTRARGRQCHANITLLAALIASEILVLNKF
jgi:hypothetical protein